LGGYQEIVRHAVYQIEDLSDNTTKFTIGARRRHRAENDWKAVAYAQT
jgi:hypothetical protein